jgi:hypothetical protein
MPEDILAVLAELYKSKEQANASAFSVVNDGPLMPVSKAGIERRFSNRKRSTVEKQQTQVAQAIGLTESD